MVLKLVRKAIRDTYTIGDLFINDVFFCNTLEDKVRDLNKDGDLDDEGEGKVYGESAIGYGTYNVVLTYSNRFKKVMPLVENVKGFAGIRIHAGNTAADSHGCILVGTNNVVGQVTNSKAAYTKLMARLSDAVEMKETILIKII